MSSHHTQAAIDLYHTQVNAGKERKAQRQESRVNNYMEISSQLRMEYNIMLIFGFIGFAYTAIIATSYLGLFARYLFYWT